MAKRPKKAAQLTTHEALDRVFGKGAAKKLHEILKREDAQKGRRKPKKLKD
jgi:hypothetical protein